MLAKCLKKQMREEKSTKKKNHFSLAVPIHRTVDAEYSNQDRSFLALATLACYDAGSWRTETDHQEGISYRLMAQVGQQTSHEKKSYLTPSEYQLLCKKGK